MNIQIFKSEVPLAIFLQEREAKKLELNKEVKVFVEKLEAEIKKNKEVYLFSVLLTETTVFLGGLFRENFFSKIKYPSVGLSLRKIDILYEEYVGDDDFMYCNNIIVRFCFNNQDFNYSFSFNEMLFIAEGLRVSEQTIGYGFEARFVDEKKYIEIRDAVDKIKKSILEAEKPVSVE
ncbi:MAG: hypothetical protein WC264_00790 [Candidatus Paceibacterota bacterium]|jgi:hypothetical protein